MANFEEPALFERTRDHSDRRAGISPARLEPPGIRAAWVLRWAVGLAPGWVELRWTPRFAAIYSTYNHLIPGESSPSTPFEPGGIKMREWAADIRRERIATELLVMGTRVETEPDPTRKPEQPTRRELLDEIKRLRGQIRDLQTDRRLVPSEPALEADRRRLNDFARATSGWLWEMDEDCRFTYFSPNVYDITGLRPEWHYGKSREDIGIPASVSPDDWQAHLDTLKRREPFHGFVFQRRGPDGLKWMQTSGVPVHDERGNFRGYRGVATDVTALVMAEKAAERLMAAIENISEFFALWGPDNKLVMCNARFREINAEVAETTRPGTRFEDHIRAALEAGLYPQAAGREEAWFEERLRIHQTPGAPVELERQGGQWLLLAEHRLPDGSTATISTDITQRKLAEFALAEEHGILDTALKTIPDGVQVLNRELELVAWNDQLWEVMDLDGKAILSAEDPGKAFRHALARRGEYGEGDVEELVASREAIARTTVPLQYERQLVTGKWIECRGNPIDSGGYLAVYRDITESKKARDRLEYLAAFDPLTETMNRRRFMSVAKTEYKRAVRYGHPVSFLLLDVDHFKSINDRYGHSAGDEALRLLSDACRKVLRDVDSIGRIGGEEFAIVLPNTDRDGAQVAAERLRRAVATLRLPIGDAGVEVTVSVGAAEMTAEDDSAEAIVARADAALYEAKRAGRNRVCLHYPN